MYVQCKLVLLEKVVLIGWMHKASVVTSAYQWADQEFSGALLPDPRLVKRLIKIGTDCAQSPTASLPEASGNWPATKAAYRFFDNKRVTAAALLQPHQVQTGRRMAAHPIVLVVQDTTGLNFADHPATEGLGLVGSGRQGALGMWLHSSLAFAPEGAALGVVAAEWWIRDPQDFGKAARRQQRPIAEKESHRWLKSYQATVQCARENPGTQFVNIADREGDLHDLFALAGEHPGVGVLVRARHERKDQCGATLSELLGAQTPAGIVELAVPRKPGQPARLARLAVKFTALTLAPPQRRRASPPLNLWVVEAQEILPSGSTSKPLHWRLVTNVPVPDFAAAAQRLGWYRKRWSIEEYHRILKSGCGVEQRQLETVARLGKIIMLDLLVAWRVLELTRVARQPETLRAREYFGADELAVLTQWRRQHGKAVHPEMTVREAVRWIAQLGGFLARKSDGEPGSMTLWRGLERLSQMTQGYQLAKTSG
jgi:hypothetical protein